MRKIRTRPCNGSAITDPIRTSSLVFATRLPSMRTLPASIRPCANVRLFTSRMKKRYRSSRNVLPLQPRQYRKGVFGPRGLWPALPWTAMTPPGPGLASGHETDFGHQVPDGRPVEADAGCQGAVDRIFAAMLPDMMGMGRQAIGKVNA
jgi:hypothetical protein